MASVMLNSFCIKASDARMKEKKRLLSQFGVIKLKWLNKIYNDVFKATEKLVITVARISLCRNCDKFTINSFSCLPKTLYLAAKVQRKRTKEIE